MKTLLASRFIDEARDDLFGCLLLGGICAQTFFSCYILDGLCGRCKGDFEENGEESYRIETSYVLLSVCFILREAEEV